MPEEQKDVAKPEDKKEKTIPLDVDKEPIVTEHTVSIGGRNLNYSVTTGMLPLRDEFGEVQAGVFFVAYILKQEGDPRKRPLMFSFNGGPGSSSVWLHLGALGPKRVVLEDTGELPPPPYQLVDNEYTWLEETDLVFIDPVGTGYSRPAKKENEQKYWGITGDIESIGEFVRLYLTRYERWASPLFLVGESYGTTRAAGLSGYLLEHGITFNGIVLVSSILSFLTTRSFKANDLPAVLFLPTYTATAWYHKRLAPDLQDDLQGALRLAEEYALGAYASALAKGSSLPANEREEAVRQLSRLTGLRPEFIDYSDLRVNIHEFCKELLRDQKRTVGRLDSRFKGIDERATGVHPDSDPTMDRIRAPYTSMFNDYVRRTLGYKTDAPYNILGKVYEKWDWGSAGSGMPDTSEALRNAMTRNPHMKLFVASGYYDLATPYFATMYTLDHLGLDSELRSNITTAEYEAGHMMYVHKESLEKLKREVSAFLESATGAD
jgi:carboxypeptidase C (cathepsin A)